MLRIKGAVLKSRLAFVEENGGVAAVDRVLGSLPAPDQAELRAVLASNWYAFELGKRLDDAIVQVIGGGKPDFFLKLGRASADRNLTGVHKGFIVQGDPHAFLAKTPLIYSFYYDTGRREYVKTGPQEAVLTTHDATTFSSPDCLTIIGWHVRALEMCGARDVVMKEEECRARGGEVCRYRVRWA
jgi:uncharacterized protein (TIGR02265 family)